MQGAAQNDILTSWMGALREYNKQIFNQTDFKRNYDLWGQKHLSLPRLHSRM